MAAGKILYSGSSTGDFTTNTEYDIVQLVDSSGPAAIVLDDNDVLRTVVPGASNFSISELYVLKKVI